MSYVQSRIRCDNCRREMNVAFGMVNSSIIAEWPKKCPSCGLSQFTKIADDWQADPHADAVGYNARLASIPEGEGKP